MEELKIKCFRIYTFCVFGDESDACYYSNTLYATKEEAIAALKSKADIIVNSKKEAKALVITKDSFKEDILKIFYKDKIYLFNSERLHYDKHHSFHPYDDDWGWDTGDIMCFEETTITITPALAEVIKNQL